MWEADRREPTPILLLSGPNLNLLGEREPEIYGTTTLADLVELATKTAAEHGYELEHVQSNHEGDLVDAIHGARGRCAAVVINAGAFTHYSFALADALATFDGREGRAAHLEPGSARALAPRLRDLAVHDRAPWPASVPRATGLAVEGAVAKLAARSES